MRLICELEWLYEPEPPGMPIHKERQKQPEPSEPYPGMSDRGNEW